MKLSKRTQGILKNFSTINQSIVVKPGNKLEIISNVKDVYANVNVDETFDKEFAIYDLNEFLGVLSLFDEPELDFGDSAVIISDGKAKQEYYYADSAIVTQAPEKGINLPSVDVSTSIAREELQKLVKAASINNAPDISFTQNGIEVSDKSNPTSNKFTIEKKDDSGANYTLGISVENVKFIADDYDIEICARGVSKFSGAEGIEYVVALQSDSVYASG